LSYGESSIIALPGLSWWGFFYSFISAPIAFKTTISTTSCCGDSPPHSPVFFGHNKPLILETEMRMNEKEIASKTALKRVEALRGFYIHLCVYAGVNLFLFLLNIFTSPEVLWFYWSLLGWGIAVLVHAFTVFWHFDRPFGADWDEKRLKRWWGPGKNSTPLFANTAPSERPVCSFK
jgi:hypothetical protein